jgi:hypothetical protein
MEKNLFVLFFSNFFYQISIFLMDSKRDASPKTEDDGKFRRPRRMIGKIRRQHSVDRAAQSMWMTEFSVTLMFRACVTLGFSSFNSDPLNYTLR